MGKGMVFHASFSRRRFKHFCEMSRRIAALCVFFCIFFCVAETENFLFSQTVISQPTPRTTVATTIFNNPANDSLRAAITSAVSDSARVDALNALSRALRFTKFSEAIRLASDALSIAERIGYVNGAARAHYNIGYARSRMGDYAQALESFVTSLQMYEKTDNRLGKAYCYMGMGNVHLYREEYPRTKEFHLRALAFFEQAGEVEGLCICANNLGLVYEKLQMYDSAMYWHTRSLGLAEQSRSVVHIGYSYFNIGAIYYRQGNYERALEYEKKSLALREPQGNSYSLGESYQLLGDIYASLGDNARSLMYFRQATDVATAIGAPQILKDSYDGIALRFVEEKAFDSAYYYRMLNVHLADSLKSASSTKRIAEMQSRLAVADQQRRIEILGQEQARQRVQFTAAIVVLVLLAALAVVLAVFIRRKQRDNALLHEQNSQILHQQTILEQQATDIELANTELNEKNFALQRQQSILEEQAGEIELANTALHEQNVILEELSKQKSEFLAVASHDLKNPLTSIVMSSSVVRRYCDKLSTEEIVAQMEGIERTAVRMRDIILNILDAQAVDEGHITLNTTDVDLVATVRTVGEEYSFRAESKQISLLLDVPTQSVIAHTDEAILRQVFDNLVSNALKYSPPQKRVWIGVAPEGAMVRLFVRDEGQGLTEDDKKKLFGRFAKLSARPTAGENSTGLGLSIVKKLVETLGGTIRVESDYGHGATFIVELPVGQVQNL